MSRPAGGARGEGRATPAADADARDPAAPEALLFVNAAQVVTCAGAGPGRVIAVTRLPKATVALLLSGSVRLVARARIQAAEAIGAAASFIEPETSTAMPTRSGGVGTLWRRVWVKGLAVGIAPAAFCASRVRAPRMFNRPGGSSLAVVVVTRSR